MTQTSFVPLFLCVLVRLCVKLPFIACPFRVILKASIALFYQNAAKNSNFSPHFKKMCRMVAVVAEFF